MALLAAVIPSFGAATSANATPTAIDLGTLGGTSSYALAINDSGQVAGNSTTATGETHAFLWTQAGGMIDLGTLGGASTEALAVNASGQVVGYSTGVPHAFSWTQAGGMIDLGTLAGRPYSQSYAVNASGQVVGDSYGGDAERHAFSWTQAGGMIDLGTLPGGTASYPAALNDSGQVVGTSGAFPNNVSRAFSWTQAGGMIDLGTLGGSSSQAEAVNTNGQVVGISATSPESPSGSENHAFSWTQAGGMIDLGTLGGLSYGLAVNGNGQVVGYSALASGGYHAYSWTQAGGMIDLGTLGGTNSFAYGVNDNGQVVGVSSTTSGDQHAFSWTQSAGMIDLGTLGGPSSETHAVNDSGLVVGQSSNASGEMHATLWETAVTATKPDAPTNVTAVAGNGQATVSWAAPGSDGGSPITGYEITISPGQTVSVGPSPLSKTITGLTNCRDYTFTVQAVNAVGTGSAWMPPNPPAIDPSAVTPSTTTVVQVGENGTALSGQVLYTPKTVVVPLEQCVRFNWTFKNTNLRSHTVTESSASLSGLGPASAPLFNSGPVGPGGSFSYLFEGAATYQYKSIASGDSNSPSLWGVVRMPVTVSPSSVAVNTATTVRWAAAPMTGYSFVVQYQRKAPQATIWPGTWTTLPANQTTGASTTFVPTQTGSFRFQARIKNNATGKMSGWSWTASSGLVCPCQITVT